MNFIKNRSSILKHHKFKSVGDSLDALEFAFKYCSPEMLVNASIEMDSNIRITEINGKTHDFSLPKKRSILAISVGKASEKMLSGLINKMGDRIAKGILIVPEGYRIKKKQQSFLQNVSIIQSSHPIPNTKSILASNFVIRELQDLRKIEMVIFLISGGSSSLMVSPMSELTLLDKREINKMLIACGADIHEINVVRKHLSQIKGGKLLRFLKPRRKVISLILSDVVGDDLSTIGSGLTYYDSSSFKDAISILQKYSIIEDPSDSVRKVSAVLEKGIGANSLETVKLSEFRSLSTDNFIIGNNSKFCQKIICYLDSLGYKVDYKGSGVNLNTTEFSKFAKDTLNQLKSNNTAVIVGGEVTNVIDKSNNGVGGRNQESICRMIESIAPPDTSDYCIICMGTDGIDGNSKSAGGLISPSTFKYLNIKGLDVNNFIQSHNSNVLLKNLNSTIETGYTGTNFNDVYLFVRSSLQS